MVVTKTIYTFTPMRHNTNTYQLSASKIFGKSVVCMLVWSRILKLNHLQFILGVVSFFLIGWLYSKPQPETNSLFRKKAGTLSEYISISTKKLVQRMNTGRHQT